MLKLIRGGGDKARNLDAETVNKAITSYAGDVRSGAALQRYRQHLKPVTEFLDVSKFDKTPRPDRILANLDYFGYNYGLVGATVIIYSIVSNPLLLIGIVAVIGAWYWMTIVRKDQPVLVNGKPISDLQVMSGLTTGMLLVFFLASGMMTLLWGIGVGSVLVLGHAAFRVPSLQPVQDGDAEELAEFAPSQGTEAEAVDDEV